MYQRMKMLLGGLILSTGLVVATPVSYAAERYRLKTILKNYKKYAGKYLVKHGADVNKKDGDGNTAYDIAKKNQFFSDVDFLK